MAKRIDPSKYTSLVIAVQRYETKSSAGLNLDLIGRPPLVPDEEMPVFQYDLSVILCGSCIDPPDRAGE